MKHTMDWVRVKLLAHKTGYSENAIRAKIKNGIWLESVHFVKAPDGRILFSMEAIRKWIEGKLE